MFRISAVELSQGFAATMASRSTRTFSGHHHHHGRILLPLQSPRRLSPLIRRFTTSATLAILLGSSGGTLTTAFCHSTTRCRHRHHHHLPHSCNNYDRIAVPPKRFFFGSSSLSLSNSNADGSQGQLEGTSLSDLDHLDTTKLPRFYIGNPELTQRISARNGLVAALHQTMTTTPATTGFPSCQADIPITLSNDQSHYLNKVLRLGKKATKVVPFVRLFDGRGDEWLAKILIPQNTKSSRTNEPLHAVCVKPLRQKQQQQPMQNCWLLVAPTKKKDRIRWMIEKCTELNVAGFLLLDTDYSEAPAVSLAKMEAYAIEAAEQCERMTVPRFVVLTKNDDDGNNRNDSSSEDETTSLDLLLHAWQVDETKVSMAICRERTTDAISTLEYVTKVKGTSAQNLAFVVGPEGGWSQAETIRFDELAADYSDDVNPSAMQAVSLGSTILRSETACVLAVGAFALVNDS